MRWIRKTDGVSLIELLVAVAILAVALIPLLGLFLQGLKATEHSHKRTIAINLARDLQEEIRSKSFTEPNPPALSGSALYYPNGTTMLPFGFDESPFGTGDTRWAKFDDADDYNGWCRGQDCNCSAATLASGLCVNNSPLESFNGKKYTGQGYTQYQGFTRKAEVYNVFPNISTRLVAGETRRGSEPREHNLTVGSDLTTFNFYDLRDQSIPGLRNDPRKGSAQGRSRLKVVKVTVIYKGPVTPLITVEDIGLVVLPLREE